jgi:hypothetical protein
LTAGHKTITLMNNNMSGAGAYAPNSLDNERERLVPLIKQFRKDVDALIQRTTRPEPQQETVTGNIRGVYAYFETEQVRIKLIEAKMWAGKILEALGNPFPAELADKAEVR